MSKDRLRHPRVAIAKIGWCESYTGDPVSGRTAHIVRTGDGHERFNFRPAAGGFYGYVPPSGPGESPPRPATPTGWLIVFVAPREGHGPLVAVGWYEAAEVEGMYQQRPEYASGARFERDVDGEEYAFAVRAQRATVIRADQRGRFPLLSGHRMRRAPWVYCRGEGGNDRWREEHAQWAESVVAQWSARQAGEQLSPVAGFADPRFAKKVDEAAIAAAWSWLDRDYVVTDRQNDNCGYDLLAEPKRSGKQELHVEVKGTTASTGHFFITRREHKHMVDPRWRLAIVTRALDKPKVRLLSRGEVEKSFDLDPILWEGREKNQD